jgi:glycosyltransferase involved in cell wall biosynthesis
VLHEMQAAQVAVLPSFAEAFALAPLEAMAAGCATIGSSLGSGPELIEDGVDGMTVDPNEPRQIAQAVLRLRADPAWARQVAARGYEKVASRFSHATTLGANLAFFEHCVLAHRRRESGEQRFRPSAHESKSC